MILTESKRMTEEKYKNAVSAYGVRPLRLF